MASEKRETQSTEPTSTTLSPEAVAALQAELTAKFKEQGLFTNIYNDEPNEVSEAHAHGSATLLTLKGSARVRLDNKDWQDLVPGTLTVVNDQQVHEVVAGPDGWEYLFACSQDEAHRQGLVE